MIIIHIFSKNIQVMFLKILSKNPIKATFKTDIQKIKKLDIIQENVSFMSFSVQKKFPSLGINVLAGTRQSLVTRQTQLSYLSIY